SLVQLTRARLFALLHTGKERGKLISPNVKKALRTVQVFFPRAIDLRFELQRRFYRMTKRIYKSELEGLRLLSLEGCTIVDVGGYRGQAIDAFQIAIPNCSIVSFEANRILADELERRYRMDPTVRIEACALTDVTGQLTLYVPFYRRYLFDGLSSIWKSEARGWLNSERLYFFNQKHVTVEESVVPAEQLDSFGLRPAIIKMSVQRAEIGVLRGAAETIRESSPIILTAYPWPELTEELRLLGYSSFGFADGFFTENLSVGYFTWFLNEKQTEMYKGFIR
ncbi:MAG: FkbM family methyltransferase, partial [Ilumatobacteraceae bacterium]